MLGHQLETLTGWKSWFSAPHEVQQRKVQSSSPVEEHYHMPVHAGSHPAGKQLCRKGHEGPGGHQVELKPAIYSCTKVQHPGLC